VLKTVTLALYNSSQHFDFMSGIDKRMQTYIYKFL